MTAEELIHEMPKGLVKWYPFKKEKCALYITAGQAVDMSIFEALTECVQYVDSFSADTILRGNCDKKYDYAIILSALERTGSMGTACDLLGKIRSLLKDDGVLLLGADNRLGIRYFCGDRDSYTERNFDSIENYVRTNSSTYEQLTGRSFAKSELKKMLETTGFAEHRFYSVFPLLERPQILFAEDYLPLEKLGIRIFPQYHFPETVFMEEERLYDTLIQNGLFHSMANGFLIECPLNRTFANVKQVTASMDRGKENAMFTIIRRDNKVEKRTVYRENEKKAAALMENNVYLLQHGVPMVKADLGGDGYVMPYIDDISALEYLQKLAVENKEKFFCCLDEIWEIILLSSEHVPYSEIDWEHYEPYWDRGKADDPNKERWKKMAYGTKEEQESIGVILKRGYIDLVPLNCFWTGQAFLFYDQELYIENLPAKVILLRTIDLIYLDNPRLNEILLAEEVKKKYGLNRCEDLFYKFISKFLNDLRNDETLRFYHRKVRCNNGILNANRQRMNYSTEEYERIFRDIFKGTDNRSLYLFGSGNFTKQFLSQFGNDYEVAGIIDNDETKWTIKLNGIQIYPPEILKKLEPGTFKVIICIKNYVTVMRQLQDMGIADFGIYDSSLVYPRKNTVSQTLHHEKSVHKKYHVGYVAGVFDLFHIGHLNLLRRAKEQCDYLIVGVVTDEGVKKAKRTMPFIPFEERIEIVRSCKYVDEAVEIPIDRNNTDEAYRRYQFDVQFSGSDYANDESWLAKREFLKKHGADMVFFPYTEGTSSTKIKGLIERKEHRY